MRLILKLQNCERVGRAVNCKLTDGTLICQKIVNAVIFRAPFSWSWKIIINRFWLIYKKNDQSGLKHARQVEYKWLRNLKQWKTLVTKRGWQKQQEHDQNTFICSPFPAEPCPNISALKSVARRFWTTQNSSIHGFWGSKFGKGLIGFSF